MCKIVDVWVVLENTDIEGRGPDQIISVHLDKKEAEKTAQKQSTILYRTIREWKAVFIDNKYALLHNSFLVHSQSSMFHLFTPDKEYA